MSIMLDVLKFIDEIAPFELAMKWDNVGLLVGDKTAEVTGCVLALDVTRDVIEFAIDQKANLIITHHPVIFSGLKSITNDSIYHTLIQNNITVISAHTNLDLAEGGVNHALADTLKLVNQRPLENSGGLGIVGDLEELTTPLKFAEYLKKNLPTESVCYTNYEKPIRTVAVVGGEGSDFAFVNDEYDAYVTGELKHHVFVEAQNSQKQIFAVGHYQSEVCVLGSLKKIIQVKFSDFKTQNYLINATRYL